MITNSIKRKLKMIGLSILSIIVLVLLAATLFINISPQFGGTISKAQKLEYAKSNNYKDGKFINLGEVSMSMNFKDFVKSMKGYFSPLPNTTPEHNIPVVPIDSLNIVNHKDSTRIIWFGHSTFLLQMNNKNILIDPMFGDVPAPHPMLGTKRFSNTLPIEIEQLPKIDAVLISHDHYDHLDYGSIMKLKAKVDLFYTPLGVAAHLQEWGISPDRIVELDWWQEQRVEGLTLVCTPAQHFSGRSVNDRGNTLWSSWVIQSETEKIFFSGDSGYGDHFKAIGEKYGPFDFAMLECGQYNEMWSEIHMMPEETVQAGMDLRAKQIMPIHWGAFKLAMHSWTDPVERIKVKADELKMPVSIPRIGEEIYLNQDSHNDDWWMTYE